jgi:hypothetical protein
VKRTAALLCVLVLATACASKDADPGAQGDGSRLGSSKSEGKKGGKGGSDKGSKSRSGQRPGSSDDESPSSGIATATPTPPSGSLVSHGPPSPVDPSLAKRSSTVEEPQPDGEKEGLAPGYAEILEASIQGLGKDVRFTLRFDGQVPDRMDDENTYMVIGWAMSMGGDQNYAFSARASKDGWETYAAKRNEAPPFPGTFEVEGDSIVIQVPWTFLDGPRAFKWYASSSWFKSLAGTTHYLFDAVPNEEAGKFPN